jgi:hypothetical protein
MWWMYGNIGREIIKYTVIWCIFTMLASPKQVFLLPMRLGSKVAVLQMLAVGARSVAPQMGNTDPTWRGVQANV